MDIRQLRSGNLVTTNGEPAGTTKGNIYNVLDTNSKNRLDDLIGSATIATKEIEYRSLTDIWAKDLEPIEITEELLEKIGFKKDKFVFSTKIGFYDIDIVHYHNCDFNERFNLVIYDSEGDILLEATVSYLNQLQNMIYYMIYIDLNVDNLITK